MASCDAAADRDSLHPPLTAGKVALVLIALAMGGFAIGVTEFAAMSILPDFAAGLGVDAPTAGHVISAYAAGVVVGAPILAVLGARLPRWPIRARTAPRGCSSGTRPTPVRARVR